MQVSRLGNPLFNEVIIPIGDKDDWNALPPANDSQFAQYVAHPELAACCRCSIPACSRTWPALASRRRAPTWSRSC